VERTEWYFGASEAPLPKSNIHSERPVKLFYYHLLQLFILKKIISPGMNTFALAEPALKKRHFNSHRIYTCVKSRSKSSCYTRLRKHPGGGGGNENYQDTIHGKS
jgi:hypothetical protein